MILKFSSILLGFREGERRGGMLMTLTEISIDTGIQGCVQPHTHAQCTVHLLAVKVLTPDALPSPKGVILADSLP